MRAGPLRKRLSTNDTATAGTQWANREVVFNVAKIILNSPPMKTQKEILKWLQANLGSRCTAPLTSTDCYALVTSVNLSNLISYSSAPTELFAAYGAIVRQMQPHTRGLAYHAIACEL